MNNEFLAAIKTAKDHAREVGAIKSISTTSSFIEDHGIRFGVRVVENLARKQRNAADNPGNPFLPFDEHLFVADISETHVCLLNKFNVVDHHILFVTKQYESQQSLLTWQDFEAIWFGLRAMDGLMFFNSCETAGASQKHKHLQMVPCPLIPQQDGNELGHGVPVASCFSDPEDDQVICHSKQLPFSHAYAKVAAPQGRSDRECAEALRDLYLAMLQTLRLWHPKGSSGIMPHNLLVSRRWLWVVPRAAAHYQGIAVNALGFAGTFLLKNHNQVEQLKALGPVNLLAHVT